MCQRCPELAFGIDLLLNFIVHTQDVKPRAQCIQEWTEGMLWQGVE